MSKNLIFTLLSFLAGFCFTVFIYNFDIFLDILGRLYENQVLLHACVLAFYFFLYIFLSKKIKVAKWSIGIITIATPLLIDASVLVTNHDKIPIRFPFASIFPILGVILGWVYTERRKSTFYTLLGAYLIFLGLTYSIIMPKLFFYSYEKNSPSIENSFFANKFKTIDNKEILLKDTCNSKCVLIECFFSGCIPCEQKRIVLDSIKTKFSPNDMNIIYICDGTVTPFEKFITYVNKNKQDGVSYLYDGDSTLHKKYNIHGYPFELFGTCNNIYETFEGFDQSVSDEYISDKIKKINKILDENKSN